MLELLEGRAGRQPHRESAGDHRGQGVGRAHPGMGRHLGTLERDFGPCRQLRCEEPRIEPTRQDGRRDPPGERHEQIGPQSKIERFRDRPERRLPTDEGRACLRDRAGREAGDAVAAVGQQDTGLLEQLANGRDVDRDRRRSVKVAAEASRGIGRRHDGAGHHGRPGIARVHPSTGEDVHVGRECHRRRSAGQQDLEPSRGRTQEDDARCEARWR